jgi:(p)ppGpp synthase/HD superfamily hydrolase
MAHLGAVNSLVPEQGASDTEAIVGLLRDAIEDYGSLVEPILRQRLGGVVPNIVERLVCQTLRRN